MKKQLKAKLLKTVVRSSVFETASSAVHSLVFKHDCRDKLELKVDKKGYVHINLDKHFGREFELIFDQETKLKYVMTCLYCYNGKPDINDKYECEDFFNSYEVEIFIDAFCDYTKTKGIKIDSIGVKDDDGYYSDYFFNHQIESGTWDTNDYVVNLFDPVQLVDFIFNPNVGIELNSD